MRSKKGCLKKHKILNDLLMKKVRFRGCWTLPDALNISIWVVFADCDKIKNFMKNQCQNCSKIIPKSTFWRSEALFLRFWEGFGGDRFLMNCCRGAIPPHPIDSWPLKARRLKARSWQKLAMLAHKMRWKVVPTKTKPKKYRTFIRAGSEIMRKLMPKSSKYHENGSRINQNGCQNY